MLLEAELPGDHGRVLRGPHARVELVEFVYGVWAEIEFGVAEELLPEGDAGEFALIVGVAVGPVEALESFRREAR